MKWRATKNSGFTIVELLVVVVVIAILAAIATVSYNGIQNRARDAQMRNTVNQLEKAIYMWALNHNTTPAGAGHLSTDKNDDGTCTGGVGGWVRANGSYTCSLNDMLLHDNLIPANLVPSVPVNKNYGSSTNGSQSLMFYPCGGVTSKRFVLLFYLASPTPQDEAEMDVAANSGCSYVNTGRTVYGMRGVKVLTFD